MPTVEVPIPPSVNRLWRIVKRWRRTRKGHSVQVPHLARTTHYERWLRVAVPLIRIGLPVVPLPAVLTVTIRGGRGWSPDRDLDNACKAVLDAVVQAERLPDDSVRYVRSISMVYLPPVPGLAARCEVGYSDDEVTP